MLQLAASVGEPFSWPGLSNMAGRRVRPNAPSLMPVQGMQRGDGICAGSTTRATNSVATWVLNLRRPVPLLRVFVVRVNVISIQTRHDS